MKVRNVLLQGIIFTGCALFAYGWAAAANEAGDLAARVKRLEDVEQIGQLLREYGVRLDARDFRGYSELFADEGEWIGGFGRAQGPAAILALMEKNMPARPGERGLGGLHMFSNPRIDVNGDRATAVIKWAFIRPDKDNRPMLVYLGHYDDTLIRERGQWKFLRRVAAADIPYSDPLAAPATGERQDAK
jgi:hypothetical protein